MATLIGLLNAQLSGPAWMWFTTHVAPVLLVWFRKELLQVLKDGIKAAANNL